MQVTYQKRDGTTIKRNRNTMLPYKIGETTSMGWKVLNIEYEYNGEFYSEYKHNMLVNQTKQNVLKRKQRVDQFTKEFKTFLYYFIAVILVNFLRILMGI